MRFWKGLGYIDDHVTPSLSPPQFIRVTNAQVDDVYNDFPFDDFSAKYECFSPILDSSVFLSLDLSLEEATRTDLIFLNYIEDLLNQFISLTKEGLIFQNKAVMHLKENNSSQVYFCYSLNLMCNVVHITLKAQAFGWWCFDKGYSCHIYN